MHATPAEEDWPPIPHFGEHKKDEEAQLINNRNSNFFDDTDLSVEAAGFVGSDALRNLFERWPGWMCSVLCCAYFTAYAVAYGTKYIETGLKPDDGLLVLLVLTQAFPAACAFSCLFLGMCGCPHLCPKVAGVAMGVQGLLFFGAWMIPAIMRSEVFLAVESGIKGVCGVDMFLVFVFKEEQWSNLSLRVIPTYYLTIIILAAGFGYMHVLHLVVPATIFLALWSLLHFMRYSSLRDAELAMKEDERRYNEAWDPVAAGKKEELARLTELVNTVKGERVSQPFGSLQAVYEHAADLNDWYQAVVKHIADVCGVKFHAAPIKAVKRAKEKIHRSYDGDFRRVLDILRSTIVVEDIADVSKVFSMVLSQAHVHQVKNRFDLNFDSTQTAGYRDLNCQLTFPQLVNTEFEGFVFELQVHYTGILELKSNEGHKRYIKLRNLRGD